MPSHRPGPNPLGALLLKATLAACLLLAGVGLFSTAESRSQPKPAMHPRLFRPGKAISLDHPLHVRPLVESTAAPVRLRMLSRARYGDEWLPVAKSSMLVQRHEPLRDEDGYHGSVMMEYFETLEEGRSVGSDQLLASNAISFIRRTDGTVHDIQRADGEELGLLSLQAVRYVLLIGLPMLPDEDLAPGQTWTTSSHGALERYEDSAFSIDVTIQFAGYERRWGKTVGVLNYTSLREERNIPRGSFSNPNRLSGRMAHNKTRLDGFFLINPTDGRLMGGQLETTPLGGRSYSRSPDSTDGRETTEHTWPSSTEPVQSTQFVVEYPVGDE